MAESGRERFALSWRAVLERCPYAEDFFQTSGLGDMDFSPPSLDRDIEAPDEDILDDVGISWEMDRSWEWGRRADACGSPCPPSCVPAVWGRPGWARRI
ncbi:hypothetical protein [Enterocloster asparagiformis]|nr:hypothetical protein [Enterocloster asparagiformis]UWO79696.1 hypothetical protein NQ535_11010 [[Clostridium] asparagiforme DSM 15981]